MKKICIMLLIMLLVTTGCKAKTEDDLIETFSESLAKSESYILKGNMEIYDGQDTFKYSVESSHLKDEYYKVVLINETNNHEQIILRNEESVYVITPALNKSFKFDSVWPNNSSQSYLLGSILKDIESDEGKEIKALENGYEVKSVVNYPNNGELKYQIITFNEDMQIKSVEVYDSSDNVYITVVFSDIDMDVKLKVSDFDLSNYVDIETEEETEEIEEEKPEETETTCEECSNNEEDCESSCSTSVSSLDNILYPMYVPSDTTLTSAETVMTDYSERVILTFAGASNFVLIEELSVASNEFEVVPINGNPVFLNDTVAAISTNSIHFTKQGVDYYILSNDLTSHEMVSIANSIGNIQSVMSTK